MAEMRTVFVASDGNVLNTKLYDKDGLIHGVVGLRPDPLVASQKLCWTGTLELLPEVSGEPNVLELVEVRVGSFSFKEELDAETAKNQAIQVQFNALMFKLGEFAREASIEGYDDMEHLTRIDAVMTRARAALATELELIAIQKGGSE